MSASGSTDQRADILGRISGALGREARAHSLDDQPPAVAERLTGKPGYTRPRVNQDLMADLVQKMESVQMSVVRLQRASDVPAAVAFWLDSESLSGDVTVAPAIAAMGWPEGQDEQGRHWRMGAASGTEATSVTSCLAAVAETGSVALVSGTGTPATLNFLPENHIVIVRSADVVEHVEDAFERVRALGELPRALNFVTGPSRTADIEQTIEIGAHGPRRMHVLIIDGD